MIAPDRLRRMTRTGALLPASLRPADDTDLDPEPREPWPVPVPAFLPGASLDDGTAATDPPPAHWSPPDDRFAAAFERLVAVHALSPYG